MLGNLSDLPQDVASLRVIIAAQAEELALEDLEAEAADAPPQRRGRGSIRSRNRRGDGPRLPQEPAPAPGIDAALIARFLVFRPDVRRRLPTEKVRVLRALTTKRAQIVETRKRLMAQIKARIKQGVPADLEGMDEDLKVLFDTQIKALERRIEQAIGEEEPLTDKAKLLRSIPGIGPVTAAMPELGRMTAAMTGLAPIPHDSGPMRRKRAIGDGRRSLRQVLFQAALTAIRHNPNLKTVTHRLREKGKPHKVIMVAIARRLIVIANAILKNAVPWTLKDTA